jgi:coenzyme F420-reducing hydrogenase delta subunit/NAD-dependent dihydropyrimidine dehydrogenase PreA subunit
MSEKDPSSRTGVFLCRCGGTIPITIDIGLLESETKGMSGVVHTSTSDFLCHLDSRKQITETIVSENLDRVVIAACSPLLYGKEFREAVEKGRVKGCLMEMANIREQCAFIHSEKEKATPKAAIMIGMAVAKLAVTGQKESDNKAVVKPENCSGCGVCLSTCRVSAVKLIDDPGRPGRKVATVDPKMCEGCGACVAACPSAAMDQNCFSNHEVTAEIDALTPVRATEDEGFPNIVVFTCNWCSYAAGDLAGIKRMQGQASFKVIRTMCSARVDPEWVMRALSRGADGVLILAGKPGRCHYEVGSIRTNRRMLLLKEVIQQLGFDQARFRTAFVDSDQPELYQQEVEAFIENIKEIGPNPTRTPEPLERVYSTDYQFGSGISEAAMKARNLI